jgi:ABC-type antimicrobial peptide transport system permease subunit
LFKNYIKITFRNIFKHKGYSFINIAGLAIGMACCLLITLWVLDELSYDKFHENASQLYRVEENQHYSGRVFHVNVTPYPLGPALKEKFPEIVDAARVIRRGSMLLRAGEQAFFENTIVAVDPSFLKMFTFPLVRGDVNTALDSPNSLVITEEMARKYFAGDDPMGKVITINNQYEFTVSGVLKNIPHNTILQFDMLLPYAFIEKMAETDERYARSLTQFGSNSIYTFVQLQENASFESVNEKIFGFIRTQLPQSRTDLELMPFTRIHLHAYWGYEKTMGGIQYVYIFSIIAIFVLLIACINFMNLATARSSNRAQEVGMRKVVGALKQHLIRQFYGESVIFALVSLVFAVGIVFLLLPAFSSLAGKELSFNITGVWTILAGILGITLFTGLVAGSYPALFLSSFQPVKVLKGSLKSGAGSSRFRKILVVFQFTLSILLIIGTTIVYKQLNYMKQKKLGWDREHLISIPMRGDIRNSYQILKDELSKDSRILGVTASQQSPSNISSNSGGAQWEGKDPEQTILIGFNAVDYEFTETLDIEMLEGRPFSREFPSDVSSAFLINEEVAKVMDKPSVVGEKFRFMGREGTIIGVMKNFHYQSVRENIEPLAIYIAKIRVSYMLVRIPSQNISDSLRFIEKTWNRIVPAYPFDYQFMDENFDRMYRAEERIGKLLNVFSILAVFVACLGLFGLASFTAEQRTKEIGIRKVLGATVPNITVLLCREFFLLVLLANVIAWPAAYFAMKNWLQNYAYKTGISVLIFFGAMAAALVIAIISVSFQAIRAAAANPVKSLKYE